MADPMIDANEAKRILGCNDATLKDYINTGQLRAQDQGGRLMINAADVSSLASSIESDDGTIILAEDSEDLSIDLGEVVEDSQATLAADSQDAAITFDESDQLELVDFDDDGTGVTDELSFTESNTAVMSEVDETLVDATGGELETVDYGELEEEDDRRPSSRRSVHSQRFESISAESDIGPASLVLTALVTLVLALGVGPFLQLATTPSESETYYTGEKVYGAADGAYAGLAATIAGFSVEPDPEIHERLTGGAPHRVMAGVDFRYSDWLDGAETGGERVERAVIDEVRYENGRPVQAYAKNEMGDIVATYNVELDEGATVESHDYRLTPAE
ncbi:MAG: helix-turn-helix domain-containing protein [Planctomycetota bacterium]